MVKIEDMGGTLYAATQSALREALSRRHGRGVNEFWLSHDDEKFPVLAILVREEIASVSYMSEAGMPGWKAVAPVPGLEQKGDTVFYVNTPQESTLVANDFVVPFSIAEAVAEEFLSNPQLPSCVEWFEL